MSVLDMLVGWGGELKWIWVKIFNLKLQNDGKVHIQANWNDLGPYSTKPTKQTWLETTKRRLDT